MPVREDIKKVLVIGSGPIQIGQAAEFDYSGSQACKSLREEGIEVVLVNSNPATIMTDPEIADRIYIEPIQADFVARIIEKETPDGIIGGMGGQTGLNITAELAERGILEKYGVKVLGTPVEAIHASEDRDMFRTTMESIDEPVPGSKAVNSVEEALELVDILGLPLIIRPAYTLGGFGGGIAYNIEELKKIVEGGLKRSRIHQVLVEESVIGWKEIEYEVMRDSIGTCITICNMENIDPMGVHTGESIVVTPTQTLSDVEHQMLRSAAIKIISALKVEGGCNIQFALKDGEYRVIEVNPRVSRSSALASKATGYPIARVAAKIAIGYHLDEIPNDITRKTPASFEPTIDYVVVKIPRWPFDKFPTADQTLTTSMKSTGEVMAIGRTFEEALMKAVRGLDIGYGISGEQNYDEDELLRLIRVPTHKRLTAIYQALKKGYSPEFISELSGIDIFYIKKIRNIVDMEKLLKNDWKKFLRKAKRMGFTDRDIGEITGIRWQEIKDERLRRGIKVTYKMVDTCAAEFEAETPYYYSTYEDECEVRASERKKVLIVGAGPIRIGQGIEFDYCTVHAVQALREEGIEALIVNNNPETVSTDYDTSDKLFFEPLTLEDVMNIIETEQPYGVVLQFGGQTSINLAVPLHNELRRRKLKTKILGTHPSHIDIAEDREKFSNLLRELGIPQPESGIAFSFDEAKEVAEKIGYPVLVRPSYVLGGRAMEIVYDEKELEYYMKEAVRASPKHPVLIDKFLENAIEVDVDAVCDGEDVFIGAIMEHIEEAGIHSGDSACVIPPQSLGKNIVNTVRDYTIRIALSLSVVGLINIQMAVKDGVVYVLEVNPRASRTVPYVSKATGIPLAKIAMKVIAGRKLRELGLKEQKLEHVAVKEVVLPFDRLNGVDPVLGPEMKSTGEVMGVDTDFPRAFYKAQLAAYNDLPLEGVVFVSVDDRFKEDIVEIARNLKEAGLKLIATKGTRAYLKNRGIESELALKVGEGRPHVVDLIKSRKIDLIINIPGDKISREESYIIRRTAVDYSIPYITTVQAARAAAEAIIRVKGGELNVRAINDYWVQ